MNGEEGAEVSRHLLAELPQLPIVRVRKTRIEDYPESYGRYKGRNFLLLGEIRGMTGHVTIVDMRTGAIVPVIHDDDLECVPEEEI